MPAFPDAKGGGQKILPPNLSQELGVEAGPGPLLAQLGDPSVPAHRRGTRNRAELAVCGARAGELLDGKGRPSQQNDICETRVGKSCPMCRTPSISTLES